MKEREVAKDKLIAELKNQLMEVEEKNKQLKNKESEYTNQLAEKDKDIDNLTTSIEIHLADAAESAYRSANTTPVAVKPISMLPPISPVQPPSKIIRLKAKERVSTAKPEFVYKKKPVTKKTKGLTTKQPNMEEKNEVIEVDNYVSARPVKNTKRLVFSKNHKVWHVLEEQLQGKIRLIGKKAPGYVS